MTLRGLLVVILEIIFIILAFGTEFKNFLIIALCIGGLLAFSFISLLFSSISLGANATIDMNTVHRTEKIRYTLKIHGIALFPVAVYYFVKTTDTKFSTKRKFRHSFMLLPTFWVNREFVFEMTCIHIGEWEIGLKKMRVEDLFGFFSLPVVWCKKANLLKKISVQPNIHNLGDLDARESVGGQGATNLLNSENGELLADSRLYRDGDALRRINWKLSARTKKLYSRMFETPQEPTVAIIMDTGILGDKADDIIDISCETAISLSNYFTSLNTPVKLVFVRCEDTGVKTFKLIEPNDIYKVYGSLTNSLFTKQGDELEPYAFEGMQILNSNKAYFISDNPSDELVSIVSDMKRMGKVAYCVVPCGEALESKASNLKTRDAAVLAIASADQIKEKVGEVV